MTKQTIKTDYLLNYKGKKFKANSFLGLIWKFFRNK